MAPGLQKKFSTQRLFGASKGSRKGGGAEQSTTSAEGLAPTPEQSGANIFAKTHGNHSNNNDDEKEYMYLVDELQPFAVETFDSAAYAALFFETHPVGMAKQRCRELVAARNAAETTLQNTVSANYEPFLAATTRINEVEGELASLGAGLRSMKHTIERLQDASRQQREAAGNNNSSSNSNNSSSSSISNTAPRAFGHGSTSGNQETATAAVAVPAWVWSAPAAVDDDLRERRFASAAATVAKVRAWQSEALQSDDHGSNESGIAKSSRELFACLNAVETGAAQVVEEVARSCFERAHIHGHSSSSGGGSLDMRSGNVSGGGFGGFLGGEIGGRGAYSRGHSSTSPAGYHSGSGGGSGRLLTEVWGGVQTSAAEDDNADLRILVDLGETTMAAAAFCALRSATLRQRVHTAGREILPPPMLPKPASPSSSPLEHLRLLLLPSAANAAVTRAAAVLSACFDSLSNDQCSFRVVFSSSRNDSNKNPSSRTITAKTDESRVDDGSISPLASTHLMAPAYQRLLQWMDSEVKHATVVALGHYTDWVNSTAVVVGSPHTGPFNSITATNNAKVNHDSAANSSLDTPAASAAAVEAAALAAAETTHRLQAALWPSTTQAVAHAAAVQDASHRVAAATARVNAAAVRVREQGIVGTSTSSSLSLLSATNREEDEEPVVMFGRRARKPSAMDLAVARPDDNDATAPGKAASASDNTGDSAQAVNGTSSDASSIIGPNEMPPQQPPVTSESTASSSASIEVNLAWAPPLRVFESVSAAALGTALLQSTPTVSSTSTSPQEPSTSSSSRHNPTPVPTTPAAADFTPLLARHWSTAMAQVITSESTGAAIRISNHYAYATASLGMARNESKPLANHTVDKLLPALVKETIWASSSLVALSATTIATLGDSPLEQTATAAVGGESRSMCLGSSGKDQKDNEWQLAARRATCIEMSALLDGSLALLHARSLSQPPGAEARAENGADGAHASSISSSSSLNAASWADLFGWQELEAVETALASGVARAVDAITKGEMTCKNTADSSSADAASLPFEAQVAAEARTLLSQHLTTT